MTKNNLMGYNVFRNKERAPSDGVMVDIMINTKKIAAMALVKNVNDLHLKDNYSNIKEMRAALDTRRNMAIKYLENAVKFKESHPAADDKDINYFTDIIMSICDMFSVLLKYQSNGGRYIVRF